MSVCLSAFGTEMRLPLICFLFFFDSQLTTFLPVQPFLCSSAVSSPVCLHCPTVVSASGTGPSPLSLFRDRLQIGRRSVSAVLSLHSQWVSVSPPLQLHCRLAGSTLLQKGSGGAALNTVESLCVWQDPAQNEALRAIQECWSCVVLLD